MQTQISFTRGSKDKYNLDEEDPPKLSGDEVLAVLGSCTGTAALHQKFLTTLPEDLPANLELTELKLGYNSLRSLPASISKLQGLEILNLNGDSHTPCAHQALTHTGMQGTSSHQSRPRSTNWLV